MVNIPVVFCFDSRIILGASVAIKSLIDSAIDSTSYDIRIFHSDLSLKNQKSLVKLTEKGKEYADYVLAKLYEKEKRIFEKINNPDKFTKDLEALFNNVKSIMEE